MITMSHMSVATDATHTVLSRDGTKISYLTTGSGPSVLVIPGASLLVGHSFGGLVALEVARNTPPWLMKLLLPLFLRFHERKLMLGLLPENLREHQEVARLDSSYENYREIAAGVLLMYGGKSNTTWVDLAMERLAVVLPRSETKEFPKLDHFGIDKKPHEKLPRQLIRTF